MEHNNNNNNSNLSLDQQLKNNLIQQYNADFIQQGKYTIMDVIGKGSYGIVAKAQNNQTNEIVAFKVQNRQTIVFESKKKLPGVMKKRIFREIHNHKKLTGHPSIVDFKEVFLTRRYVCIVMELVQGSNMYDYCINYYMKNKTVIAENEARSWFQQLITSQKFCHDQHIVNRDIKLQNSLLFSDQFGRKKQGWWGTKNKLISNDNNYFYLKICDFGFSKDVEASSLPKTKCGTIPYFSPEVLFLNQGEKYDGYKSDIWAFGVMLYILQTASFPFDPSKYQTGPEFFEAVKRAHPRYPSNCPASQIARNLVYRMLDPNPATRISIEEIINHRWFQINLPDDWNKDFSQEIAEKQQQLQSREDIEKIVDENFEDYGDDVDVDAKIERLQQFPEITND